MAKPISKETDVQAPSFSAFGEISGETWQKLHQAAIDAQSRAYAPYSKFQVGAALLTDSGEIVLGCNVENATFGATICAERVAITHAVILGQRSFKAICVITNMDEPAAPCGICRQAISEFCKDLPIMSSNPAGTHVFAMLDELLPHRFSGSDFLP